MEPQEHTRKNVKGRGIDPDTARRSREERAIQIRKEKRFDRANIERRKFKTDDTVESAAEAPISRGHCYTILPQKCAKLLSGNPQEQLESAMYFRRILAADKNPPLDMILEANVIIPALIQFLSRTDLPSLQVEAAWSLTNIACGEPRHIHCLLQAGALGELLNTVASTKTAALKDQALWAICNMTAVVEACEFSLTIPNFLVLMMQTIGLQCEVWDSSSNNTHDRFVSSDCVLRRVYQQESFHISPTLSTMRHVTFICGNIARQKQALPRDWYRMILYVMSELVHSPDDEIVLDICACLITLLQDHPELAAVVLEVGMVHKMKENIIAISPASNVYDLSLLVLCALLRSPVAAHRSVVVALPAAALLQNRNDCSTASTITNSTHISSSNSSGAMESTSTAVPSAFVNAFTNMPSDASSFGTVFHFGPSEPAALHNTSTFGTGGSASVPANSVLGHIVRHLGRTESPLTKSDLCRSLVSAMDMGPAFAEVCVQCGLERILERLLLQGAYDLKIDAGELLCALVTCDGLQFPTETINMRMSMLRDLLAVHEPNLLVNTIWALKAIANHCIMHQTVIPYLEETREQLDALMVHPVAQIADLACSLEDMLSSYADAMDSDDEEY